jgi:hypothetical protein
MRGEQWEHNNAPARPFFEVLTAEELAQRMARPRILDSRAHAHKMC